MSDSVLQTIIIVGGIVLMVLVWAAIYVWNTIVADSGYFWKMKVKNEMECKRIRDQYNSIQVEGKHD